MLKLKNVVAGYGNIVALRGISLEVNEGEIITLIGANGAGKSTTLMTISGIVAAREGTITFLDQEIQNKSPETTVKMGLSQVPEGRHIFPQLTVQENLDMGAFLRRDADGIKKDMQNCFDLFPILARRRSQAGGTLSGGEQQMLAVARALMTRPKLLLLDEPSMGLAPLVIKQIFDIIKEINRERGVTVFLVEQNANQALQIADCGYVLENGTITLAGKAQDLLKNSDIRKAYLGI
ncbi:ABC transporter ATP-binding protein [Desulforhopalus vacuolatus]|uniref:ABC transporter ATP-binding protein n=1 Tax=Desulforhopalus vacuolatus TaxID=40414 RepID=UPI00196398A3|nr:ABC transporter ATP-binding protein [Desulforhopalus vacuolatus]MBM9520658.1 ABC transporter ATP-binding protein [Desulforhopalus vacuolatus]